jgi:histidyl-tRNA synthetase
MQFDADIVGTKSRLADAEVVAMMTDTMDRLGARAQVRVNDRLLLDGLTHKAGIEDKDRGLELIGAIDKTEKIGPEAVVDEIAQKFDDKAAVLAKRYLGVQGTNAERIKQLQSLLKGAPTVEEGVDSLHDIFRQVSAAGYSEDQITFDQTIARGLNYYTGTIYETSLLDLPKIGSVCSGGRYDNLVKALGGPDLPAVGTSVGVDRLFTGLQAIGKVDLAKTHTKVLITNFSQGDNGSYLAIASSLRHSGIPTEVYYDSDKLGKQLRSASKKGIQFALMAGEDELASNMVTVKDLSTGQQENISQSELVNLINSHSTPQNG